jgi:hypothetical protein
MKDALRKHSWQASKKERKNLRINLKRWYSAHAEVKRYNTG